jgi:hypothetical protein
MDLEDGGVGPVGVCPAVLTAGARFLLPGGRPLRLGASVFN